MRWLVDAARFVIRWLSACRRLPHIDAKLQELCDQVRSLKAADEPLGKPRLEPSERRLERSVSDDHLNFLKERHRTPMERAAALLPGEDSPRQKMSQLESFLLQGTEILEEEWKTFQTGGSSSLASFGPRMENAVWRLWQKARHATETTSSERPKFRRRKYVFMGGMVGAVVTAAALFATREENTQTEALTVRLAAFLNATFNTQEDEGDLDIPGLALAKSLRLKHPLLMIPGIVSSGLEVWQADSCLGAPNSHFRKRLWGQTSMLRIALQNITCWLHHLKLAPGQQDPPRVKLRAATGFDGADYLLANYWVWAKLLENLAMIGYDVNSMRLMPYDWRLSYSRLQERDYYFSRLRKEVEELHEEMGEKVVVIAHSMGVNVWFAFMDWIAKADSSWVDRHVHTLANLGGPLLGAMGPLTSLLSGEFHMGAMAVLLAPLLRNLLGEDGRLEMRDVARTWGSLYEILPKGGDLVWGSRQEPTDCRCDLITRKGKQSLPVTASMELLMNQTEGVGECAVGFGAKEAQCFPQRISWDPFSSALPKAPNLKVFCMYGVGVRTERAYSYTNPAPGETFGRIDYTSHSVSDDASYALGAIESARMDYGLSTVDGDGTVPLLSLGYMCKGAWRDFPELNPANIKPVVREYIDMSSSLFSDARGGPKSAKHVEMLGNHDIIKDVMHLAAGREDVLSNDRDYSRIGAYPRSTGGWAFEIGEPAVGRILERVTPQGFTWELTSVCAKDSQEITDDDRAALLSACETSSSTCIIITHGTDTLIETAKYLGSQHRAHPGLGAKRICLTGAMRPERFVDTDAHFNLGVCFGVLNVCAPGVYVCMNGRAFPWDAVARDMESGAFLPG
ncbi:unnamed protein product [Effrenium voratum]|uniref:L-asparaginase N-terminal domain-containing protein n=1 Tax=Effrenium voratum TaxID=2562239 RepID=A0AA36HLG2_9DINO|nr:unnamed protein product [Effrenium voratum]